MAKDKEMPGQPTVFTEISTSESELKKLCKWSVTTEQRSRWPQSDHKSWGPKEPWMFHYYHTTPVGNCTTSHVQLACLQHNSCTATRRILGGDHSSQPYTRTSQVGPELAELVFGTYAGLTFESQLKHQISKLGLSYLSSVSMWNTRFYYNSELSKIVMSLFIWTEHCISSWVAAQSAASQEGLSSVSK
jgi:hypothetical protein